MKPVDAGVASAPLYNSRTRPLRKPMNWLNTLAMGDAGAYLDQQRNGPLAARGAGN